MSGPKSFRGELIEGSFHSHQVPLPNVKTCKEELAALQTWLSSYHPNTLFESGSGVPVDEILSIIPKTDEKKLGQRKEFNPAYEGLKTPEWMDLGVKKGTQESCMKAVGRFLKEIIKE